MTADQLIAQAAENRSSDPPPSLDSVERGLRQLLEAMLAAFNYEAESGSSAAHACRIHAMLLAEVREIRRIRSSGQRSN